MKNIQNLENLRFGYESILIQKIVDKLGFLPLINYGESQFILNARRSQLLGDAVLITQDLSLELYAIYQDCLNTLGGDLKGDLFVQNNKDYNASVFANESRFDILINSALVEDFNEDKLKFVIGHELGHVIFEHSKFPAFDIIRQSQENQGEQKALKISKDIVNLMLKWSRAAEVSADRIGLLCCKKLTEAIIALFETSSGLKGLNEDKILKSFRGQYDTLEKHIKSREDKLNLAGQRMHPMIPIRFKALELAALDIVSLAANPNFFNSKSFNKVDNQISFILESFDF